MFPSTGSGLPFPKKYIFKAIGATTFHHRVVNLVRNIFLQNVEDETYKCKVLADEVQNTGKTWFVL